MIICRQKSITYVKRNLYKILALISIFTYVYPVSIVLLPVDTGIILHAFGIVFFLFKLNNKISRSFKQYFYYSVFLIIYGTISTVLNDAFDFSLTYKLLSFVLYLFSALFIVDIISKTTDNFSCYTILKWLVFISIIQAILSFTLFFVPEAKIFWMSLMKITGVAEENAEIQARFRLIAIAKTQYANMAVVYGLSFFSLIILAIRNRRIFNLTYFLYALIICSAGILSARIFFIFILGAIVMAMVILAGKGYNVIKIVFCVVSIFVFMFFSLYYSLSGSEYESTFNWVFEWYVNLQDYGKLQTVSTDNWKTMIRFPDNLWTWIFGDGLFQMPNGSFYQHTDIGYLRSIYYWGIIGSFFFYLFQYLYYLIIANQVKKSDIRIFLTFVLIVTLLYNVKEFWYANMYWAIVLAAVIKEREIEKKILGATKNKRGILDSVTMPVNSSQIIKPIINQ